MDCNVDLLCITIALLYHRCYIIIPHSFLFLVTACSGLDPKLSMKNQAHCHAYACAHSCLILPAPSVHSVIISACYVYCQTAYGPTVAIMQSNAGHQDAHCQQNSERHLYLQCGRGLSCMCRLQHQLACTHICKSDAINNWITHRLEIVHRWRPSCPA